MAKPKEPGKDYSPNWGGRREGSGRPPANDNPNPESKPKAAAEPRRGGSIEMFRRMIEHSNALARKRRGPEFNPFQLPQHPPQATPPAPLRMAMDQNFGWASGAWASGIYLGGVGAEGQQFLGFPYLAELAQRPEYRVISETIADDATRKWVDFEVTGKEKEKKTPGFEATDPDERKAAVAAAGKTDKVKALKDEMARLELRDRFYTIARDDGFFGRSHLFLDFGGDLDDPRSELMTDIGDGRDELSKSKIAKGSLKRLQPVEAVWTYPTTYNAINPLKQNWYSPDVWYVLGKQIHRSRLPTFIGHPVPDLLKPAYSFGGLSLSQMAKPYVDIWLITRESVGVLVHSFSVMVLSTDMQSMLQPGSGAPDLMTRVAMFNALRDNQGTFVINEATEDFKNVSASLSGLHELQAQAQEHMASVSRIPLVKLTGISPSGLNASSEGEIRAYYDTIAAYQNRFFRPHLTRIINFMQLSLWGEIDPEITFDFEPLWELSQKEKSEKEKDDAARDQIYVDMGAVAPGEIRKIKIDDPTLPYTELDPDDVPDLREEEEAGLEPEGGRPQPLAEKGPGLGEGEMQERGGEDAPSTSPDQHKQQVNNVWKTPAKSGTTYRVVSNSGGTIHLEEVVYD